MLVTTGDRPSAHGEQTGACVQLLAPPPRPLPCATTAVLRVACQSNRGMHRLATQTGEKHAYDIPLSTLKHTSSAKWAPRSEVLHHDAQRKQREAEQAVGPYAQYPGERPSTIGKAAVRAPVCAACAV